MFIVHPGGRHPGGTQNSVIDLSGGAYLELISPDDVSLPGGKHMAERLRMVKVPFLRPPSPLGRECCTRSNCGRAEGPRSQGGDDSEAWRGPGSDALVDRGIRRRSGCASNVPNSIPPPYATGNFTLQFGIRPDRAARLRQWYGESCRRL